MVARNYERLSEEDKKRFDQMKELTESAKQETGEYSLIEDLMARIVGERFGAMKAQDVKAVMGKLGEGAEGGKHVKKEGSRLTIKSEPGAEAEKVVISAIVPAEESTLLPYCVKETKEEDCETIGTDSDVEEINKEEVRNILRELAGLKRREAECYDRLAKAVPDMQENEVVIVAEKVRGTELPQCVYQMNERGLETLETSGPCWQLASVYIVCISTTRWGLRPCPFQSSARTLTLARPRFTNY